MRDQKGDGETDRGSQRKGHGKNDRTYRFERWTAGLMIAWAASAYVGYLTLNAFLNGQ
jgi:hypothetical protein